MELVEEGLEYGKTERTATLYEHKGDIHLRRDEYDAAEAAYRRMLELAETHDLGDKRATAVSNIGSVAMERADQEIDLDHLALDEDAEETLEDVEN